MPPSSHPRRSGTADVKGAGCPGGAPCAWVPIPKRAHLPWHLALPSQAQHHPAGEEAGSSAAWAEGPMHPMLPSTTATNPGVHGSSVRGRPHYLLTEPSAASDGLLAHELYDRGQADGTILPLCLVLMLARGLGSPQLGLAAAQDHTASRHLRSPPPKPIRGWFSPSHTITRLID